MDQIGGQNVSYYYSTIIEQELLNNPELLKNKKFMELFIGSLVARFFGTDSSLNLCAGFPLKRITKQTQVINGPPLLEIINSNDLIADSDVDVCIGDPHNPNMLYPCQITRLVANADGCRATDALLELLAKKLRVQPDKRLILIINIEDEICVDLDKLNDFLGIHNIPFGYIFLIGKADSQYGNFVCFQIFPKFWECGIINIKIPL